MSPETNEEFLTVEKAFKLAKKLRHKLIMKYGKKPNISNSHYDTASLPAYLLNDPDKKEPITRKALAIILDLIADPFSIDVDHYGTFILH